MANSNSYLLTLTFEHYGVDHELGTKIKKQVFRLMGRPENRFFRDDILSITITCIANPNGKNLLHYIRNTIRDKISKEYTLVGGRAVAVSKRVAIPFDLKSKHKNLEFHEYGLSELELAVANLLYEDYTHSEIRQKLHLTRDDFEKAKSSIWNKVRVGEHQNI